MPNFQSIRDLSLSGQRVLMRVDFNVPQDKVTGAITNTARIAAAIPSIKFALEKGASVVLMSHLGRPDGQKIAKFSLKPVAAELEKLLGRTVTFLDDCVGPAVEAACAKLALGTVVLLENLRFHIEEEGKVKLEDGTSKKADPAAVAAFRASLTQLGDVFVNDAFGAAHRAHASTTGIAHQLPQAAMGLLMAKELKYLQGELTAPAHPFVVILGGSKVSDKIGVIKALMEKANTFLIGGAMAYTFFRALGIPTGNSRVEADKVDLAKEILALAEAKGVRFLLPVDNIETQEISATAQPRPTGLVSPAKGVTDGWEAVDIGPETIERYKHEIAGAKTILWNGPVGIFELTPFATGTRSIAEAVAEASAHAVTIIGGGDSVTAVKQFGFADRVSFCSTGGGASLELIEGKTLPGVAALTDKA